MRQVLLLVPVFLVACGGSIPSGGGPHPGRDAAGSGDTCSPDTTRLGAECWSAGGTHWRVTADGPGGTYRFELELLAAGRVRATDHEEASPAVDEWFQDGSLLRVFLGDGFVEYRSRVTNGTILIGEAINTRGQRWSFSARRQFGELPCEAGEAASDRGCFTVEGTRWRLGDRVVEFLGEGRVAVGPGEGDVTGGWSQRGSTLTFTLGEGGAAHTAAVSDPAALSGTVEGGEAWHASRIPPIPPVMHE